MIIIDDPVPTDERATAEKRAKVRAWYERAKVFFPELHHVAQLPWHNEDLLERLGRDENDA
jgi:hypothetical protein